MEGNLNDTYFLVKKLASTWLHGLSELPGYDAEHRLVRLTTRLDVTSDEHDNSVGFLGRAHPLVRRAIDRVRALSFGAAGLQGQDQRVSAVRAKVPEPQLLFTFLGRVNSLAGRELEKVLAVKVAEGGEHEFYESADAWSSLADPGAGIRTTDLWKTHFASWGVSAQEQALAAARSGFAPSAKQFIDERKKALKRELANQQDWLKKRAEEVAGESATSGLTQGSLFDSSEAAPAATTSAWRTIADPQERLAALHSDREQPAAARVEADGVLRIYGQRMSALNRLLDLREPEVVPLGVLMLIPEAKHGA